MASIHQFLAQPALVYRILVFGRDGGRGSMCSRLGGGQWKLLMDMGLDRQALEEEAQKRKNGQPPAGGSGS